MAKFFKGKWLNKGIIVCPNISITICVISIRTVKKYLALMTFLTCTNLNKMFGLTFLRLDWQCCKLIGQGEMFKKSQSGNLTLWTIQYLCLLQLYPYLKRPKLLLFSIGNSGRQVRLQIKKYPFVSTLTKINQSKNFLFRS